MASVAALYQDTFFKPRHAPPAGLTSCLEEFYLSGPTVDPDIRSLVHVDDRGAISGFVGVNVVPMIFEKTTLRAAFCGALMVRDREQDPMAGARLLKSFLSGPQDVSLSETANKTSLEMSKPLKGISLAPYSLEWMKVLRPAAFACDTAFRKSALRKWTVPIARSLDRLGEWSGIGGGGFRKDLAENTKADSAKYVDADEFTNSIEILTSHYQMRPGWSAPLLQHVVRQAFEKPLYGQPIAALVTAPNGPLLGAFLYHLQAGGVGRVLQILALPGREGKVIDYMLADADRRGAAGLRGRTQPAVFEAMLGKGILFANASSTIVFSQNESIVDCFRRGGAFVNGLAGESWGRHIGGEFG
jgi:hypothetical protein